MNTSHPTVTVGIAAYNAEKNIAHIIDAVLQQDQSNYSLDKLIVHCDQFPDQTTLIAKSIGHPKVVVVETSPRKGFAHAIKKLLEVSRSDITILLNDDIKILDNELFQKLVAPFIRDPLMGLVTGNPRALPSNNFVTRAIESTDRIYEPARYHYKNGQSANTCDGKILVFSRLFIEKFSFPKDWSLMACVDAYLYFANLRLGLKYNHVRSAVVYGRNPSTFRDYISLLSRTFSNKAILERSFDPTLIRAEYFLSKWEIARAVIIELFRNPLGLIFVLFVNRYVRFKAWRLSKNFNPTWDNVSSSKSL